MRRFAFVLFLLALIPFAFGITPLLAAAAEPASTQSAPPEEPAMDHQSAATVPHVTGHPLSWIQFATRDLSQTSKFFTDVFGWQVAPFMEMTDFSIFSPPTGLMGGFQGQGQEGMPDIIVYIYVEDIDLAYAAIADAGGTKVMDKMEVPGAGGFIGFFKDPAGVTYGLTDIEMPMDYSPLPFGTDEKPLANTICSMELYGGDFTQTAKFFSELFTWGTEPFGENYMAFSPGSGVSGVFQNHTPATPVMAYIWSDDVHATVAKIQAAGGKLLGEIVDSGEMGLFAYFTDPAGVTLGLIGK